MSKFSITVSHQASRNADVPGQTVEMCSKTLVKWLLHIRQISGEISGSVHNLTINLQSSISKTLDGIFQIAEGGLSEDKCLLQIDSYMKYERDNWLEQAFKLCLKYLKFSSVVNIQVIK